MINADLVDHVLLLVVVHDDAFDVIDAADVHAKILMFWGFDCLRIFLMVVMVIVRCV